MFSNNILMLKREDSGESVFSLQLPFNLWGWRCQLCISFYQCTKKWGGKFNPISIWLHIDSGFGSDRNFFPTERECMWEKGISYLGFFMLYASFSYDSFNYDVISGSTGAMSRAEKKILLVIWLWMWIRIRNGSLFNWIQGSSKLWSEFPGKICALTHKYKPMSFFLMW